MISVHNLLRRAFIKAYEAGVSGAGLPNEKRILDQEWKLDQFMNEYDIPEILFLEGEDKSLPPVNVSSDICAAHKWASAGGNRWHCIRCGDNKEGRNGFGQ